MREHYDVELKIGGEFDKTRLNCLIVEAITRGLFVGWDDQGSPNALEAAILKAAEEYPGMPVSLTGSLDYRDMEGVMDYCQANLIPFVCNQSTCNEYDSERIIWMPGWTARRVWSCLNDGATVVHISLDELRRYRKRRKGLVDVIKMLEQYEIQIPAFRMSQ